MAAEARAGWQRGHRAFKIKIGRGARHMPLEEGMARDIAVVRAVRAETGPAVPLMVDANNGYNLNLAKRFLSETADCNLYWLEEAFHEDAVLYRDLREWMNAQGLQVLIADGEGDASSNLMEWARERLIDAVQRDIISWGFSQLLALSKQLGEWGCLNAPHHYGTGYGNYASCHLGATPGFAFVEWDEAAIAGISAPGYAISNGRVSVPDAPGFGLVLDEQVFAAAIRQDGFTLIR
jgi:L-alanine-DL-glutamate epimerase-like enolase superfamily enzyme